MILIIIIFQSFHYLWGQGSMLPCSKILSLSHKQRLFNRFQNISKIKAKDKYY
jgi:hypothetical protein